MQRAGQTLPCQASSRPSCLPTRPSLNRRCNISFVNRQRGSGTRVLLDYNLKQMGLASDEIRGYSREEYSHLAVAVAVAVAAVKGGSADTGLGIMSAARALEVDFIPLFKERYDLVVPRAFFDSDLLRPLRELMEDPTSAKK